MEKKRTVDADATRAYMFSIKTSSGVKAKSGGYQLTHKPSSYVLSVRYDYFVELCEKIEEKMEK